MLEQDIATLEHGLETVVGPRGVRLSGGQVQRAATARAFACAGDGGPELLVLDDLSSALDVHTEQTLWTRIRERPDATVLAVSNRRAALHWVDQIVLLHDGHIAAIGNLSYLLENSAEMQRLYQHGTVGPTS